MPLALPCTAQLLFLKMNSTLLVLGCCLSFCSSVCPSPVQMVPLLLPLSPLPGGPKLQLPILSGGSAVSCPVLNCFGLWSVQAALLQPCASLVLQSHQQAPVLQLDLLPRLFPCLGTLGELVCSPGMGLPEEASQEDFFLCKSGFVLRASSTCCQVGLSQAHSGKGLLSTSCFSLLSVSWPR